MRIGFLLQTIRGYVSESIAAKVTQAFGNQEQNDRPADQKADRVNQPVIARGIHQCRNTQERSRRHKVTGDGKTVLQAGDFPPCGVVVLARAGALGGPIGDIQRGANKQHEHDDRLNIQRLAVYFTTNGIGKGQPRQSQQSGGGQ
ncbi:Uncharacterised protein [Serratia plymuthica]|uniref:Uncharacterized protein n=1 Tax=Serratia plymuthica TaxID=82996 RepID=A0A2X4TU26_SERPL|nr:Uncharacterised protein [Serratia plymuthica]